MSEATEKCACLNAVSSIGGIQTMSERGERRAGRIYHERQSLMLCGVHALNNALQRPVFTKQKLDEISECLHSESSRSHDAGSSWWSASSWINPYRSAFGLGNYDVSVLERALAGAGWSLQWARRDAIAEHALDARFIEAWLVNRRVPYRLAGRDLPLRGRHWSCLRWVDAGGALAGPLDTGDRAATSAAAAPAPLVSGYYDLDSKLAAPVFISSEHARFYRHLSELASGDNRDAHFFVIVSEENERNKRWSKRC